MAAVETALKGSLLLRLLGTLGVIPAMFLVPVTNTPNSKQEMAELDKASWKGIPYRLPADHPDAGRASDESYRRENPGSLNALANDPDRWSKLAEMIIERIRNIQPLAGGSFFAPPQEVVVTVRADPGTAVIAAPSPGSHNLTVNTDALRGPVMPHLAWPWER